MKLLMCGVFFGVLFLAGALEGQNNSPETRFNIQYGRSCGDENIYFWMNAPDRGKMLKVIVGVNQAGPTSTAMIGIGVRKVKYLVGIRGGRMCYMLTHPLWYFPMTLTNGNANTELLRVPPSSVMIGLVLYAQCVSGNDWSRGIEMVVQ